MTRRDMRASAAASSLFATIAILSSALGAQSGVAERSSLSAGALIQQVERVRDGRVVVRIPSRPEVCGDGATFVRVGGDQYFGSWRGGASRNAPCQRGPLQVALVRRGGNTTSLETTVGGEIERESTALDLGAVSAAVGIEWLMREVEQGSAKVAEGALLPLTLADGEVPWQRIVAVARDQSRPREVRSQALFWSGQQAGERAADAIGAIVRDDPDAELRKSAVFALSRSTTGINALLEIARTSRDREVKKAAFFWLGQSKDPRAAELFAEVLARPAKR